MALWKVAEVIAKQNIVKVSWLYNMARPACPGTCVPEKYVTEHCKLA